jgi:mannobiose 2-epimerase
VASLADRTYAFLRDAFVVDDAFVFKVSRDGSSVVDDKRQIFAECYAIYALATYGRVLNVAPALALALDTFDSIDTRAHDDVFGGYDQRGDPGFLPAGSDKGANTHLHLLEAFTALYEATGDALVAARLDELADLMASTLLRPPGYVHAEFALDWTPLGVPELSYGHDLETAWLLLDAARVLGRESDTVLEGAALQMVGGAGALGFDSVLGGYFERGQPGGAVVSRQKVWWVQLEALLGLWTGYEVSGNSVHLDRFEATLRWIETTEDLPAGEWFATRSAEGALSGADYKGDEWKASYHVIRAFTFAQDRIDSYRLAPPAMQRRRLGNRSLI